MAPAKLGELRRRRAPTGYVEPMRHQAGRVSPSGRVVDNMRITPMNIPANDD